MADRHTFYKTGPTPCTRKESIAGAPTPSQLQFEHVAAEFECSQNVHTS